LRERTSSEFTARVPVGPSQGSYRLRTHPQHQPQFMSVFFEKAEA
jgi:hypothetical protein